MHALLLVADLLKKWSRQFENNHCSTQTLFDKGFFVFLVFNEDVLILDECKNVISAKKRSNILALVASAFL